MKKKINNIFFLMFSIIFMISSILISNISSYYFYIRISSYTLLLIYIIVRLIQKDPIQIIKTKLDILVTLLVLSTAIPIIFNTYTTLSGTIQTILQYIYAYTIYILLRELSQKEKKYMQIFTNISIVLTVIIIIIGIDNTTSNLFENILRKIGVPKYPNGENRLISVFGYPNTLAAYISSILFFNIDKFLQQKNKLLKSIYKTITAVFFIGIILTYSKAIMILLPIFLFAYIVIIKDKKTQKEIIQNIFISLIAAITFTILFEKFSVLGNYLLIWILFTITVLIDYFVNVLLENLEITDKKLLTKKSVIFIVTCMIFFVTYIIIGLNIYDEYPAFDYGMKSDYNAKIISNISGNTKYTLKFDIDAIAPNDLENSYTINVLERDSNNQEIKNTNIKFGTFNGEKQIEFTTNEDTSEIKIEFKCNYEYNQKKLIVKTFTINDKLIPLKYKYLPTKLVEKIKNININYKTSQERIEMIKNALKLSTENFLTGKGGNAWEHKYEEVQSYKYISNNVHSYPAKIMLEFGLLGIISYVGIAIITIYILIKFIKGKNIKDLSIVFAFLVLCVHSIIDADMEYMHILIYTFGLMGLLSTKLKDIKQNNLVKIACDIILILITISCIYFNIDKHVYTKYSIVVDSIKQRNGLVRNSPEYQEVNARIAKNYEYVLQYERYNQLEIYFKIVDYYMNSNIDNKLEVLENYYDKISNYKNVKLNTLESIILKPQGVYNIINYLKEQNNPEYKEIMEKFSGIIIDEYDEIKEQLQNCLVKQHLNPNSYISYLDNIYNKAEECSK